MPQPEPIAIEYKRWKNKKKGYKVELVGVHHNQNSGGLWYTQVVVRGSAFSETTRVVWPVKTFLRMFKPIGRKMRILTRWERLLSD